MIPVGREDTVEITVLSPIVTYEWIEAAFKSPLTTTLFPIIVCCEMYTSPTMLALGAIWVLNPTSGTRS